MASGGKREGAGRKPNPTKQVRIPVRMAGCARKLVEVLYRKAQKRIEETDWWQTCPADEREEITLTLTGVEERKYSSILGCSEYVSVVVAVAEAPNGETKTIYLRLDKI